MNRRKKLWIACAALVVVVVLCASALVYQPVPYRFLKGATLDHNESGLVPSPPARVPTVTVMSYEVSGTVDEVTAEARKELTPEKGWIWLENGDGPTCQRDSYKTWVNIYSSELISHVGPPHTIVMVVRPTTLVDRVLNWLRAL